MESKFAYLRKQLDRRGYRQPFDVNSLQLVEKLLNDLTQSKYALGHNLDTIVHHKGCGSYHPERSCVPRPEYGRISKENSELRQQISTIKEEYDKEVKGLRGRLRKIEIENGEIRLLNNQHQQKIQQLEKESKRKSDKLQEYQEKNLQTIIQTTGGKNVRGHQRMEIENMLPPSSAPRISAAGSAPLNPDSRNVDLLRIAEQRIHQLQMDVEGKKMTNDEADNTINKLKLTVRERGEEIERLHKVLEVLKPYSCGCSHGHLEHQNVACFGTVHGGHGHLDFEFEHLKRVNQDLEKRLKEAVNTYQEVQDKNANLINRNDKLEKELTDVDRVAQALKKQKEDLVNAADSEMGDAKEELETMYTKVEQLENELAELKREKEQLEQAVLKRRTEAELIVDDSEKQQKFSEQNRQLQQENKQLGEKLRHVTLKEQELQLKLLQLESAVRVKGNSNIDGVYLQQIIDSLEKQRDHYKNQLEKLNRSTVKQNASTTNVPRPTPEPHSISSTHELVKLLEDERDLYKLECLKLKGNAQNIVSTVPQENNRITQLEAELGNVTGERDKLKKSLENLENHIDEIDKNLRETIREKEKLQSDLNLVRSSLESGNQTSRNFNSQLNTLEERDKARADLQQTTVELQDARNRLRLATETQITERKRLERRIAELETQLLVGNDERAELLTTNSSYKAVMVSMQEQIQVLQTQITDLHNDAEKERSEANQLKAAVEQKEKSLKEVQRLLSQRISDRSQAERKLLDLEARTDELKRTVARQKDEMAAFQKSISTLDREKDALQMEVDKKTEDLATLRQETLTKSNDSNELRNTVNNLEIRIDRLLDDLHDKDNEVRGYQRHLEAAKRDLQVVQKLHENSQIRNRQLEEDLAVMTRDNQALQRDLKKANDEKENITLQVQGYVTEVARIEDLLRRKEQERAELFEQYHNLTSAASDLESHNSVLETQASNVQLELLSKETELNHTRDAIEGLNREIEEYFARQQLKDNQILDLRRNLSDAEARLFSSNQERDQLRRDLTALRELCMRLESGRDKLVEEMSSKESEADKMEMLNLELRQEVERLRSQMNSERMRTTSLEELLAGNRQKEFHIQLSNRELITDVAALKERLTVVESKLEEQTQVALRYRTQVSDLELELAQLKRQLTNERFERERLHQELKRFKPLSPGVGSAAPSSAAGYSSSSTPLETGFNRQELPSIFPPKPNPGNHTKEFDRTNIEHRRVFTSNVSMDVRRRTSPPLLRNTGLPLTEAQWSSEPEVIDLSSPRLQNPTNVDVLEGNERNTGRSADKTT